MRSPLCPATPIFRLPQLTHHLGNTHRKQTHPLHLHRRISARQSQSRQKNQTKNHTPSRAPCPDRPNLRYACQRRPSPYPNRNPSPNPACPQHHPLSARAKRNQQKNQPQPPIRRLTAGCLPRPKQPKPTRPSPCPSPCRQLANRADRRIPRHRPPAIHHLQNHLHASRAA